MITLILLVLLWVMGELIHMISIQNI